MSTDIAMQTTDYQVGDRTWHLSRVGNDYTPNVTLDVSKFSQGGTNEVQTVTLAGSPTSFVLTLDSHDTPDIDGDATAAEVQSALESLPNVGVGNVTVTGSGPYSVKFSAILGNVAQMTGTTTGGTSASVTVATTTAGANAHYANGYIPSGTVLGKVSATGLYGPYDSSVSDGRQTATGILFADCRVVRQNGTTATKVGSSQLVRGDVRVSKLPFQSGAGAIDSDAKTDLSHIRFEA